MLGAQRLEYRLGLQAFTHRRRVHPHERPFGITLRRGPSRKTGGQSAPPVEPPRHFLVEAREQRCRARGDVHAEAIQKRRLAHLGVDEVWLVRTA